ncbi:MAG: exodeoxyribonuclease V subunit gamma [Myxococcota bacterium]
MRVVRSNRTEVLADALGDRVRETPLGPFAEETIVVQSRGMERWLTLQLAERLGVWANPSFPFPRTAIERVLEDLSEGASPETKAYDPERLKWTLARILDEDPPAELEAYLGQSAQSDRSLNLAQTLASVFDRYIVYRPRMLQGWGRGRGAHWQATLWRRLQERLGPNDLASRIERALPLLRRPESSSIRFERLHLFSLETLPPAFIRFFGALSTVVPTDLYLLTPTTEYLSDLDDRGQLSLGIESGLPEGHPLLTSLGSLSRDFQDMLLDEGANLETEQDAFSKTDRTTLLRALQSDIVEFRGRPAPSDRTPIDARDDSISVHACASPMREVMVLHDVVREALERDETLSPEDIVVMTPDLETHAPAFRAVFGEGSDHPIPFEVHDRRTRDDSGFYDDFLAVMEVLESRFSVLDIVRLMDAQSWRRDFRFTPEERTRLTELLEMTGIRWGIDAAHRDRLGFPSEGLHTWRAGLGRLFLGFTSTPGTADVFAGLLPRGDLDLGDAELVARLSHLCGVLFDFCERWPTHAPVTSWTTALGELSTALFAEEDDQSGAVRTLRGALETIGEMARKSGHETQVALGTVRRELAAALVRQTPAAGFLRRGVTLSELVPLRSIPFRMICLLGMNEDAFPRGDDRPSFDLTRDEHAIGDRNKRQDDRHSFLQTILCARDRLAITFSAPRTSSQTTASPAPPVSELLESVAEYAARTGAEVPLEARTHPLHAFDSSYFDGTGPLSSFSTRYLGVAEQMQRPSEQPPPRVLRAEAQQEQTEPTRVSIAELAQWIWHPARAFIQQQLGTRFEQSALYEPTGSLTELGKLESFRVGNEALDRDLQGARLTAFLDAAPEFPDGSWGEADKATLAREVDALGRAHPHFAEAGSATVHARLGDVVLEGHLDGLIGDTRVKRRFNRKETKTELTTWLEHLLMQVADHPGLPSTTELFLRSSMVDADHVTLAPVDNAASLLALLLDLHRASRQAPAALLNRPSWTFATLVVNGKVDGALERAADLQRKEQRWDRYATFAWGPAGPFADHAWAKAFEETTLAVYRPLLAHRTVR